MSRKEILAACIAQLVADYRNMSRALRAEGVSEENIGERTWDSLAAQYNNGVIRDAMVELGGPTVALKTASILNRAWMRMHGVAL